MILMRPLMGSDYTTHLPNTFYREKGKKGAQSQQYENGLFVDLE